MTFWKIEESVGGGMYITLPGSFTSKESAESKFPKGGRYRAMEYQAGYYEIERVQDG